jgi:hypothetical protein
MILTGRKVYRQNGYPFSNVPSSYDKYSLVQTNVKYNSRWQKFVYFKDNKRYLDTEGLKKEYLGGYSEAHLNTNSVNKGGYEYMLFMANKDGLPDTLMKLLINS